MNKQISSKKGIALLSTFLLFFLFYKLTKNVFSYNKLVLSSALVLLILPLLSNKNKAVRESENAESIWIMLAAIPVTLFLILVCAKTGAWYIGRADVHLVLVFYPLLSVFCLATIRLNLNFLDI